MKSPITQKILKNPKVHSISDERGAGDGFWIYLKLGWIDNVGTGAHMVHEDTPEEAYKYLQWVSKCDCDECKPINKGGNK